MTNHQIHIGQKVKINSPELKAHGKTGVILAPAFHSDESIDSFIGWKVAIAGQEWIFDVSKMGEA